MGHIGLSIYSKFMCLKSNVGGHYNFSLVHDQNLFVSEKYSI